MLLVLLSSSSPPFLLSWCEVEVDDGDAELSFWMQSSSRFSKNKDPVSIDHIGYRVFLKKSVRCISCPPIDTVWRMEWDLPGEENFMRCKRIGRRDKLPLNSNLIIVLYRWKNHMQMQKHTKKATNESKFEQPHQKRRQKMLHHHSQQTGWVLIPTDLHSGQKQFLLIDVEYHCWYRCCGLLRRCRHNFLCHIVNIWCSFLSWLFHYITWGCNEHRKISCPKPKNKPSEIGQERSRFPFWKSRKDAIVVTSMWIFIH